MFNDPLKVKQGNFGPHPTKVIPAEKKPELNIEVKIVESRPHSYIFWSIAAVIIGLSLTYSAVNAGQVAYNRLVGPQAKLAAQYSANDPQGSDDSLSATTDIDQQISGSYTILNPKKSLFLSSTEFLVGDVDTGDIILEKNGTTKSPMASVTKLMTAAVELETLNQLAYATVTPASVKYYPLTGDLIMNEAVKISDLKYPLLVVSSNVAAEVFANFVGRETFLKELNDKAVALGMTESHYSDPSGLDPSSYSTPEDLFKFAHYIKDKHPEIFDIGRIREYSILGHTWINQNHQLIYSTFAGGKNGFTDQAKKTTLSLFNLPFNPVNKNDKRTVAIILLHTNDREGDISKILSYLSSNVRYAENQLEVGGSLPGPAINSGNPDR